MAAPGRSSPGTQTPGAHQSGFRIPGVDTESVHTQIDTGATGTADAGSLGGGRVIVTEVDVDADVDDFDINVYVDGDAVFDAPVTGSGSHDPTGDGAVTHGASERDVSVEITAAGGADTADVTVRAAVEDH